MAIDLSDRFDSDRVQALVLNIINANAARSMANNPPLRPRISTQYPL